MFGLSAKDALAAIVLIYSLGCASSTDCDAMSEGEEQDHCLKDRIQQMDGPQLAEVEQEAAKIGDNMIRSFAVSTWVKNHANEISLEQGTSLCNLLEGREESYCLRRLSSPHLQR